MGDEEFNRLCQEQSTAEDVGRIRFIPTESILSRKRLDALVEKLGPESARAWVEHTIPIYEAAITDPQRFSATHKQAMEANIRAFRDFLGTS